jgi:hypothetical protein
MRVSLLACLILLIIVSYSASSFGISYPYMENDTIKLYPGQTYIFKLVVQNKDSGDITVFITTNSTIAKILGGPELKVPGETYNASIFFDITVPESAQEGDIFNINYLVSPVSNGEGQTPQSISYSRGFKVLVIEKPSGLEDATGRAINLLPGNPLSLWLIIPVLALIILIIAAIAWRKSHHVPERITKPRAEAMPASTANLREKPALSSLVIPVPRTSTIQRRLDINIDSSGLIEPPEKPERTYNLKTQETSMPILETQNEPKPTDAEPTLEIIPKPQPRVEKAISLHHYFHLKNGRSLKSLEELYNAFQDMPEDEFNHHINPSKNDFANWIEHVLEDKDLADNLRSKTTKQEITDLIKNEIDQG